MNFCLGVGFCLAVFFSLLHLAAWLQSSVTEMLPKAYSFIFIFNKDDVIAMK